jgi:V/A-type H+-transporting ATPase subunit A
MQNAFDDSDAYTSLRKQFLLLRLIMAFYHESLKALEEGKAVQGIIDAPVREDIARAKFIPEGDEDRFDELERRIVEQLAAVESVA